MNIVSVEGFHTVLLCRKWEECVAFYRDLLGFKTVDSRPGFVEVEAAPGSYIGLIRKSGNSAAHPDDFALVLTFRITDLEKTRERLAALWPETGAVIDHPWGARLFKMKDPEGRRIEIWSRHRASS